MKTKKKSRELHDCSQATQGSSLCQIIALPGCFLLHSLQRRNYAETLYPKLVDGFSLALCVLHIWPSVCLLVTENPTTQDQVVNHECTDVCTFNVLQLTE